MSKELEALKELIEMGYLEVQKGWQEDIVAIDNVNIIEKSLKALEIIKEKKVLNDRYLMSGNLEAYNRYVRVCQESSTFKPEELTQEEYELLKEVLL